jgi:hypothetical protein
MKNSLAILLGLCLFLITNCSTRHQEAEPDSFATMLGNDTLVIEQFTMLPDSVEAEVIMRTPATTYQKQMLTFDEEGHFLEFRSAEYNAADLSAETPMVEQTVTVEGDSLVATTRRDTVVRTIKVEADPDVIPFIDMVHWPYEVATRRMIERGVDSLDQPMLTGRSIAVFEMRRIGPDSISIKHPYRGTMYARIDENGAIESYDATATTRKLIVSRGGPQDMEALAGRYAAMDAEGKSFGPLSKQAETEASVHGANIVISYGQPAKRGRELFGGIVPWNQRWRTGANRATHFRTDKDLQFGDLTVPAGEYTLFTIPAPDGGTLIINKQTGQNGQTYDESRDLGRVPMQLVHNEESVELFTIDAIERGDQGVLQLKWGNTIFEVPFEVEVQELQ